MVINKKIFLTLSFTVFILTCGSLHAEELKTVVQSPFFEKTSIDDFKIHVPFRTPDGTDGEINATLFETPLTAVSQVKYPQEGQTTAIMFALDTSDPRRKAEVGLQGAAIVKVLETVKEHHLFGLSTFDSQLEEIVGVTTDVSKVKEQATKLVAKGQTTELYRAVISASQSLKQVNATRKALFVFSDGMAEDTAYSLNDAVNAARDANVIIFGFGYSNKASKAVNLQTLRRLAEETGGHFVQAQNGLSLPLNALAESFKMVDGGGVAVFDLPEGGYTQKTVLLKMLIKGTDIGVETSITLPAKWEDKRWLKANKNTLIGSGVGFLLLIILVIFVKSRKKKAAAEVEMPETLAVLEMLDGEQRRVEIDEAALKIGRNQGNDLVLNNDSISGHHAEIHRRRDGEFVITDLQSTNGIFINGSKITTSILEDASIIEIGEVRCRFNRMNEVGNDDG